jgi:hypothetical protein
VCSHLELNVRLSQAEVSLSSTNPKGAFGRLAPGFIGR